VIRLEAGRRFAQGDRNSVIAKDLRVSERSVEQRRRNWREGGMEGLKSKGPSKLPKLSDERFAVLEKELAKGPAAHGWEDPWWTLERVRTLIGRQFEVRCSTAGVWPLLHRHGCSWQSPARRALERDEHAVELWKKDVWPQVEAPRRRSMPGSFSRTRPGSR
jgi:putative transposase